MNQPGPCRLQAALLTCGVSAQATGRLPSQQQMTQEYIKPYDSLYGPTYTVLDILQRVFYTSNAAREVRFSQIVR